MKSLPTAADLGKLCGSRGLKLAAVSFAGQPLNPRQQRAWDEFDATGRFVDDRGMIYSAPARLRRDPAKLVSVL